VRKRERERKERHFSHTQDTRKQGTRIQRSSTTTTLTLFGTSLSLSLSLSLSPSQFKTQNSGEFKECPFDVCWDVS
jgi:hypothetical protein